MSQYVTRILQEVLTAVDLRSLPCLSKSLFLQVKRPRTNAGGVKVGMMGMVRYTTGYYRYTIRLPGISDVTEL